LNCRREEKRNTVNFGLVMSVLGKVREGIVPLMKVVRLKGMSILEQLHLEERLLRTSSDNWCLINDGTNSPAIVMGLSG
jgi:hypothetical protein